MLGYVWEGIRAGLVLSLLVGPLVVLLVQLSLRRGTLASFAAALGIWTSDVLYISLSHFGLEGLERLLDYEYLHEIFGTIGSILLIGVGIVMWYRDPPNLKAKRILPSRRGLLSAWAQGFALNTFNPFTTFFWSTFVVTQVHNRHLYAYEAMAVYGGIMVTIIIADSCKVLGARKIRALLRPATMLRAQRAGAVALGLFGLLLAVRVWF
ncbi:threonine/homoserine/homoserine lactone efflux protein [Neolewinella xylanilytica]|uniref:Threonine/homoserine/homoserine lactone efflux protein n=1 Tax=Neolewinella xylanilytica TaxID=1514080 RepID=A0A2S6I6W5_9BACT|nr:LysE family transporter [Neolewinella xylanilytica]PPK87215.1 threonine/homoserine/homoserine lactone efflux protein [Neolewinella xylanilytica]